MTSGPNEFTMTNISIFRDLHCWDMRFGVVPFGSRKSWNFTMQVKSSLLKGSEIPYTEKLV
jgi:hypothetical protein